MGAPPEPLIPDQSFFNIGETSRITRVAQHTLRHWEELKLLRPVRRGSGHRRYTRKDLDLIFTIKDLQSEGITLAGIKKILWERRQGAGRAPVSGIPLEPIPLLKEIRKELREIVEVLGK